MGVKCNKLVQCSNCPWLVESTTDSIPGYSKKQHENLVNTLALVPTEEQLKSIKNPNAHMACHKSTELKPIPCAGYVHHQMTNNNIHVRLAYRGFIIDLRGDQVETFEETFK